MKRNWLIALVLACSAAQAQSASSQHDFSGTYDCTGDDHSEGKYTGTVTLMRVPEQSQGGDAAYRFKLEVPGYGAYPGHGAAHGKDMAIYFANTDPATRDYGTGIASFSKARNGKWVFRKFYYEPEFKGGNFGREVCAQR